MHCAHDPWDVSLLHTKKEWPTDSDSVTQNNMRMFLRVLIYSVVIWSVCSPWNYHHLIIHEFIITIEGFNMFWWSDGLAALSALFKTDLKSLLSHFIKDLFYVSLCVPTRTHVHHVCALAHSREIGHQIPRNWQMVMIHYVGTGN